MKIDPRFKDTEFVIEADSYAMQSLWEKFSTQAMYPTKFNTIRWEADSMGTMIQVGKLDNRPVIVSVFWSKLNGHLVCFYSGTSQVVDHAMIEDWLKKYCNPEWDHGRRAHADASNFHHVLDYIRNCEAEDLLNQAKKELETGNKLDAKHCIIQCWTKYAYCQDDKLKKLAKKLDLDLDKIKRP